MAKHSPGPWKFRNHKWLDANGLAVVWPSRLGVDLHVSPADAALIARAPEMDAEIVALKEQLAQMTKWWAEANDRLRRLGDELRTVRADADAFTAEAVAKAKGGAG